MLTIRWSLVFARIRLNGDRPLDTLPYSVSTILTPHGWGRRKKFEIKALRWLENAILGLVFANTVFYKSTILLVFEAEVTESVV